MLNLIVNPIPLMKSFAFTSPTMKMNLSTINKNIEHLDKEINYHLDKFKLKTRSMFQHLKNRRHLSNIIGLISKKKPDHLISPLNLTVVNQINFESPNHQMNYRK